jgi:nucleotide-binding universal stress UspA family protein
MSAEGADRIVVGVDGSPSSLAALRWAVRQAKLTGGTVDAIIAWQIPVTPGGFGWVPVEVEEEGDFEGAAKKVLDQAIGDAVPDADRGLVHGRAVNGNAAEVLLDAGKGAALLVVGSRGHGGFAEALLGSVGQHLVHFAHSPVLIMRGE